MTLLFRLFPGALVLLFVVYIWSWVFEVLDVIISALA